MQAKIEPKVEQALARWTPHGQIEPLGSGHIHDTYLVTTDQGDFVLQRVNEYVFKDGDLVMHQTQRLLDTWGQQSQYVCPELVASAQGHKSERIDGDLWRMWRYLDETQVIDPLKSPTQVQNVARAFAHFHMQISTLPGEKFADTIEGFLQLGHYLQVYDDAVAAAPDAKPRAQLKVIAKVIDQHRELASWFCLRNTYIHGDCKVNNVLFDALGENVVAIIDFDTVMYGHWAWDFGDLVRSVCFSAGGFEPALYRACVQGFAHHKMVSVEEMSKAPAYVAFMLAVRFATDHLQRDVYFRVSEQGQNLHRAEQQFELFNAFVAQEDAMTEIARRCLVG